MKELCRSILYLLYSNKGKIKKLMKIDKKQYFEKNWNTRY
jgi:hypothetical protein